MQVVIEVLAISLLAMVLALFAGNGLSRQVLEREMIGSETAHPTTLFSEDITFDLEIFDPESMFIEEMLEA